MNGTEVQIHTNSTQIEEITPEELNMELIIKKKKKKRGRKPKTKIQSNLLLPKKRGRKPKKKSEQKTPKKRGRKPKDKYGIFPKHLSKTLETENDNLILHLPISSKLVDNPYDIKSGMLEYTPVLGEPEGYMTDNYYEQLNAEPPAPKTKPKIKEETPLPKEDISTNKIQDITEFKNRRREDMEAYKIDNTVHHTLIQFHEANRLNTYPMTTNVCCFWDTEPFTTRPISLPVKLVNNVFYVDGCFCSPECAAAYNFHDANDSDVWNKYSLLNLLYTKMIDGKPINIKLAPPRRTLTKFGGILPIEEFRKFNDNYYKQYTMIYPPMISNLPSIEKKDINDRIKKKYDYIPVDKERIEKANDELILRRQKPINSFTNTLENCMKLKYVSK